MNKKKVVLKSTGVQFKNIKFDGEAIDIDKWIKGVSQWQKYMQQLETQVNYAKATIKTQQPILVVFLGDLHVGSVFTRYTKLYRLLKKLSKYDNVFLVNGGDTVDNFLPNRHPEGSFEVIMPPAAQKILVEKLFETCKDKWLVMLRGDHENFSWITDNFDFAAYLAEKMNCPYLGWGGFLDLKVGRVTYRLCLRHRYRYNSSFNLTHTAKRMREQLGDGDIFVVFHGHQAAVEHMMLLDGKDRIFIRTGAAKMTDNFAQKLGFPHSDFVVPAVKLNPKKRKMLAYFHVEDALD